MANTNLKARSHVTERLVTIQQSRRFQRNWNRPLHLRTEPPLYPWMISPDDGSSTPDSKQGSASGSLLQGRLTITAE
jgi:toxic protein SymE